MGLLPKDYDVEQASSTNANLTINVQDLNGENKFRILGLRLLYQTWSAEGKPIRSRTKMTKLPFNGRAESKYGDEKWSHIWYCLVWSYADNDLKVLAIKQSTIQKQLAALDADDDWGSLDSYDIKIKKEGEKKETKYSVIGVPPKPVAKNIKEAFSNAAINLDALIYNCYPDDANWADKAVIKLIDNLDLSCREAAKREIEFEAPATTDLSELQTAWERAMDLMPLEVVKLPKVTDSLAEELEQPSQAELTGIPF